MPVDSTRGTTKPDPSKGWLTAWRGNANAIVAVEVYGTSAQSRASAESRSAKSAPVTYAGVARKLEEKYAPQGVHVYFCDEVYAKAQADFDKYLEEKGYPRSSHAGIPDTSEMLYLGADNGWVRKELIPTAVGNPVARGERGRGRGQEPADPNAPPRVNNGITGDARRSTAALGKVQIDLKVDYAVKQIQGFLAGQKAAQQP